MIKGQHGLGGEVLDLEAHITNSCEDQTRFKNNVLGEVEASACRVQIVDETMDSCPRVPFLPLCGGNGQEQVAVREYGAGRVDSYEDVQDTVDILLGFFEELDGGSRMDRLPQLAENLDGLVVIR